MCFRQFCDNKASSESKVLFFVIIILVSGEASDSTAFTPISPLSLSLSLSQESFVFPAASHEAPAQVLYPISSFYPL